MNEISIWLASGAGVSQGLRLLSKYAPNKYLEQLVTRAPEKFKHLLVSALSEYSDAPIVVAPTSPSVPRQKFREQWPFLSDSSCPMELKALAADKITAYHNYCDLHEKLYDCVTLEDCFETAKNLLKNFTQNSRIFLEFAYYKEHGSVLGKHEIFKRSDNLKKYRSMSLYQLAKEQRRLEGAIWRIKSEIGKGDKPHLLSERENRLKEKEDELSFVNDLIKK